MKISCTVTNTTNHFLFSSDSKHHQVGNQGSEGTNISADGAIFCSHYITKATFTT